MANSSVGEILAQILADLEANLDIRSAPRSVADKAAAYAKSIAPVGNGARDTHPGEFRDSIGSRNIGDIDGRPAAQVFSDIPAASYIEYGTSRTPEHATFAKTADHFSGLEGFEMWVGSDTETMGLAEGVDTSGPGWSILE